MLRANCSIRRLYCSQETHSSVSLFGGRLICIPDINALAALWYLQNKSLVGQRSVQNDKAALQAALYAPYNGARHYTAINRLFGKRIAQYDGFVAIWPCGNHVDRHIAQFSYAFQVTTSVDGQLVVVGYAHGGLGPAGHFFQNRLGFGNRVCAVGQHVQELALVAVTHTNLDLLNAVQHIQLGDAQTGNTVDHDRTLHGSSIKPATTTRTTRYGTELLAHGSQTHAGVIQQFGREWTRTHARGVGLGDTQHVAQFLRANTRTCGSGTGQAVAAGDEGVSTVVNIQQCALGTFKQELLPCFLGLVQVVGDVSDHRSQLLSVFHGQITNLLGGDGFGAQVLGQHEVVVIQGFGQFLVEDFGIVQILNTQGTACHLVFVGRADTATGGTDLAVAFTLFTSLVHSDVVGQDQRASRRDLQARTHV